MTAAGVGVLGVGTYLPPQVRRNDWWPADVVARWTSQQGRTLDALGQAPPMASEAARDVVRAILELRGDPFEGAVERHVLDPQSSATDMEAAAAEAALERSAVDRREIDLLLTHSAVPEYLLSNPACELHRRLGLPAACLTLEAQASAYSFLAQLALAVPFIETGRARRALLVQSSAMSRILDPDDPVSARVGDAATAVVVGPVGPSLGVLASVHVTDGSHPRSLIASVPGGRWYDGRSIMHVADPEGARRAFMTSVDHGAEMIAGSLAVAGLRPDQVGFLAVHHATPWLGRVMRRHSGLEGARMVDLFARTAYVGATSVPLVLAAAEDDGSLVAGDVAVLVAAGTGMVRGATTLRWGRT